MPVDRLLENNEVVNALYGALHDGEHGLKVVPGLVRRVIQENRWQERRVEVVQRVASFHEFRRFVEETPPEGLGTTIDMLKRLCSDHIAVLDMIDKAEQRPRGNASGHNQHTRGNDNNVHISNDRESPEGNASQTAIRRLRKDRPDLHAEVIAGRKSPHGAMVEAGFRPKTVTVPLDPVRAAQTLRRRFTDDEWDAFADAVGEIN